jgi:hypothetical protein
MLKLLTATSLLFLIGSFFAIAAVEPPPTPKPPREQLPPIRSREACPGEVEPLVKGLLRDLPSYINRISHQRRGSQSKHYAIAASQPNFKPLPMVVSSQPIDPKHSGLHQVFFTMLERQYQTQDKVDYQNHHWLFLAYSQKTGWQLAMLYSRIEPYPEGGQTVASPMRETSQEATGLAIRHWLRDCKARSVDLTSSGAD